MSRTFTAVVRQEEAWYVAHCPEVGTTSQGETLNEAVENLKEATELFLECAEEDEFEDIVGVPTFTQFVTAV